MQCVIETPIGPIEITELDGALTGIHYKEGALPVPPETPILKEAAKQFEEYFAGERRAFDLPLAISGSPFFAAILKELPKLVPYGKTASYGEVAQLFGSPGASRAVGSAMKKNPFVIVVPCHRVTKAGGVLGCYSAGGEENKRLLLKLEEAIKD